MKRWNFHFVMMQVKDEGEEMEFSLRQKKGRNHEGKPGSPEGYFVIINKINLVLFFCIIHLIFFKIQMHNFSLFLFLQFTNQLPYCSTWRSRWSIILLPQVRIILLLKDFLLVKNFLFSSFMFVFHFFPVWISIVHFCFVYYFYFCYHLWYVILKHSCCTT